MPNTLIALHRRHARQKRSQHRHTPGKHTIVFDFKYEGRGPGKGGTGVLSVDGKAVDSKKMPYTIPFLVSFDESFDIGADTRYGVDDNDYQPPFPFAGKLDKLTIKTGGTEADCCGRRPHQKTNTCGQKCCPVIVASIGGIAAHIATTESFRCASG